MALFYSIKKDVTRTNEALGNWKASKFSKQQHKNKNYWEDLT